MTLRRDHSGPPTLNRRALAAFLLLAAPACGERPSPAPEDVSGLADHHVHLLSPALVADWKSLGVPFSRPDSVYTSPAGLGVGAALLVPMSHLYGNEEFRGALGLSLEQEHAAVRRENDYVAAAASGFPGTAVALCSVDISRPYAWDEIRRCRDALGVRGLKFHLASAGIDPREESHLEQVARVAAWADSAGVALLVHFDPQRRGVELEDVQRFIDRVIAPHPGLTLVIAHLGGSGGYGAWSRSVYRTFAAWLRAEEAGGRPRAGIHFDLSAVWLERESEGVPASTEADGRALAEDIREFGTARLLLGSDYPVFELARATTALRAGAGLGADEWQQLRANRLALLDPAGREP